MQFFDYHNNINNNIKDDGLALVFMRGSLAEIASGNLKHFIRVDTV